MFVAERMTDYVHPRLARLAADPTGEGAFWADVAESRTPFIEADPAMAGFSVVTFVYRIPPDARHVVVQSGIFAEDVRRDAMQRIAGTTVCHASYRLRDDARMAYSFFRDMPLVNWRTSSAAERAAMREYMQNHVAEYDPYARENFVSRGGDGESEQLSPFVSLPRAPDESAAHKRTNVRRGWIDQHVFASRLMGNERRVWVYTPPDYAVSAEPCRVLVAFDGGWALTRVPLQRILDNLYADGRIAPTVAVLVDNPTPTSRDDELPCNETFAQCIGTELIPWLRANYRVSHAPADHYVGGASYGGLASFWMAYRLPHVFGNVVSQAASLWWGPGYTNETGFFSGRYASEWLIERYRESPRLPVRIWMEIGLLESQSLMIEPNRRMKALLDEKGYEVYYSEPCGGHDPALWRGTMAQALAKMLAP